MVDVYVSAVGGGDLPVDDVPLSERHRIGRFRNDLQMRCFVVAWSLAGRILGARLGVRPADVKIGRVCRRCGGDHGKPVLIGNELDFSLSHAGNQTVLAVSEGGQVGIDIESRDLHDWSPEMSALVLDEQESVRTPRDRATYWTRKEAVLKATGDGLMLPMSGIRVSSPGGRARLLAWREHPELVDRVRLYDLIAPPSYTLSLAVLDDARPPVGHADRPGR